MDSYQKKKDHELWSHMVPEVMRNGPGYISTKDSWSHEWWEMVLTCIWMSIPITRFIDPVDRSRSISTVDKDSPTGEYGRYRRSIRIHLQRITVDHGWWIQIRNNFVVDFIDDTCDGFIGAGGCESRDSGHLRNSPFSRTVLTTTPKTHGCLSSHIKESLTWAH